MARGLHGQVGVHAGGHAWPRGCKWWGLGTCVVGGHAWPGGHAWLGVGMCGGGCMVGGHAWQRGAHAWQGVMRDIYTPWAETMAMAYGQ